MADIPIIFSGAMVRALLAGQKTQTRRLAWRDKVTPMRDGGDMVTRIGPSAWKRVKPGDRLYVREAWAPLSACTHSDPGTQALIDRGFYHADGGTVDGEIVRWTPSIHQPRWASRLTLTITEVRVQPLLDITETDAVAEGATPRPGDYERPDWSMDWSRIGQPATVSRRPLTQGDIALGSARFAFLSFWNQLHGGPRDHFPSDRNPEVVALTFTVAQRNVDHG